MKLKSRKNDTIISFNSQLFSIKIQIFKNKHNYYNNKVQPKLRLIINLYNNILINIFKFNYKQMEV